MIIYQRFPQILSRLFLQYVLKLAISQLKGKIKFEEMPSFVIDVDEVIYLLWVNGEICGSEELLLREDELEMSGKVVTFAWIKDKWRKLLWPIDERRVLGCSCCPIAVPWLIIEASEAVYPNLAIRTSHLLVFNAQMRNIDLYCSLVDDLKISLAFDHAVFLSIICTKQLNLELGCSLLAPGLFLKR